MQDTSVINSGSHLSSASDTLVTGEALFHFNDSASTSPLTEHVPAPTENYINFFAGHELPVKKTLTDAIPYRDATPDWLFYVLLIVIASLAWIRYYYGKIFGQTLQAIFNVNITNQIVRDENILIQRTSAFLGIIFNIVFAVILYHVSTYFRWNILNIDNSFGKFLFFMLAVSAVYSFKFLLLKITGFIFSIEKEMATYIFNIFLINNMLGLVLIPLAIILSFSVTQHLNVVVIGACVLYGIAFVYRILRGALIGFSYNGVNLMYLFLYFCALEFAPCLMLLKFLTR